MYIRTEIIRKAEQTIYTLGTLKGDYRIQFLQSAINILFFSHSTRGIK